LCEFIGKSEAEYQKHVYNEHTQQKEQSESRSQDKVKKTKTKSSDNVKIPCDMCKFTSVSAENFIEHIESKHQQKTEHAKSYACNRCDFEGKSEEQFKKHLEVAHKLNAGGFTKVFAKSYACSRCDFEGRSQEQFKKHLEVAHELNAGGFTKVSHGKPPKKLCIQWNRGHCICNFAHEEMLACKFAGGCAIQR
jgi:uncharacterized C2H2 Zn-finger protein